MTLTEARAFVTQFARNAAGASAVYSPAQIDRAIQVVGNHFCRETRALKAVSTVALTSGSATAALTAASGTALTTFRPERLLAAYVSTVAEPLARVTWEDVYRAQTNAAASGPPSLIAFQDWATLNVYPTPDVNYTLTLRWTQPFIAFTAGTGSPDSVTLNIPDDWLAEILPYGPPAVLQHNEEKARYASESWKKYLSVVEAIKGEGSLGARSADRVNPYSGGGSRWHETGNVFGPL